MSEAQDRFRERALDLSGRIFELIDMRSFSNLWYWIALAVMWSSISHFVLGVPYDLVSRARNNGGTSMDDLNTLAGIKARRTVMVFGTSGVWIVAGLSFVLSLLGATGFFFGVEFAQAVFFLAMPATVIGLIRVRLAHRIVETQLTGPDLCSAITRNRVITQMIGMVCVFVTSLWGMYQNFSIGVLG